MNGFGNFRRTDGVGNRSLDDTGNGNDVAGMSFVFADAVETFISQNFGNAGAFDFALFVNDFDRIIDLQATGMYFSGHPLDDYKIIIDHMCKTQLTELENLEALKGQEIAVAGMVVSVQNLITKTGKPWGKFVLEDYNGTHEFALFSKDYENFRKYLFSDYFLFVRGRVQPKPYNDKELEFKIISMVQLSEMRDTMIKEMNVLLPVEDVTPTLVRELTEKVKEAKGETLFRISVIDREAHVSLSLFSKSHKVSLTQSLVSYLDDNEIKYSIA